MGVRDRLLIPMIAGERLHIYSAGGAYDVVCRRKQGGCTRDHYTESAQQRLRWSKHRTHDTDKQLNNSAGKRAN